MKNSDSSGPTGSNAVESELRQRRKPRDGRDLLQAQEMEAEAAADPIDPPPLVASTPAATEPSLARQGLWWMLPILLFSWSLNFIFIKIGIRALLPFSPDAPLAIANARVIVATLALALVLPFFSRELRRLTWSDFGFLLFLGATGVSANQYFFMNGLARTSVSHGSLLFALSPVTVFLLAMLSRQERLSGLKIAGMSLAILGTAVLIGSAHKGQSSLLGDVLMILKVVVFAIYTVTSKHVRGRFETVTFNFYVYFFGSALLAPVSWHTLRHTRWLAVPWQGWMAILYIALIGSVLAYLVFYRALKMMPASQLASLTYLEPLVAMTAGVLILHESITAQVLSGGSIILCGVYLTQLKKRPAWLRRTAA